MTGMRIPGMRSYSNLGCKAGMTNPGCGMTDFPVCILLGCKHSSARALHWNAKPVPSLKVYVLLSEFGILKDHGHQFQLV